MILVISDDCGSTNNVLNWIILEKIPFMRINSSDTIEINKIVISNEETDLILLIRGKSIKLSEITSVFIRKGEIKLDQIVVNNDTYRECEEKIRNHLLYDRKILYEYLCYKLFNKRGIGILNKQNLNKLIVLDEAVKVGLLIPKTYITKHVDHIMSLFLEKGNIITKAIGEMPIVKFENSTFLFYTSGLNNEKDILEIQKDTLDYSLFQLNIIKKFEIRIFYLNEGIDSIAMFTQDDFNTVQDYRRYNSAEPTRIVPFTLPEWLKLKIIELMNILSLNSGSIDMIYSNNNEYIFLEINPVGQYGMVSYPINKNFDKRIADYLINK